MNKDIKLKKSSSGDTLYRVFIYVALITLAVTIIVPVAWVFMASAYRCAARRICALPL